MLKIFCPLAQCLILLISRGAAPPLSGAANVLLIQGKKPSGVGNYEMDWSARLAAIEKAVEEQRQQLNVPGLSLVIAKDEEIILMKGFGLRDVERKQRRTPSLSSVLAPKPSLPWPWS